MTDRDRFAADAMAAIVKECDWAKMKEDVVAAKAYEIADAMIDARTGRKAGGFDIQPVTGKEQDALNLAVRALHRFESSAGLKAADVLVGLLERLGGSYS